MIKLHRWEYDEVLYQYRCVDPPPFSADSGQWCFPGCGEIVTMLALCQSKVPINRGGINASLDLISERPKSLGDAPTSQKRE